MASEHNNEKTDEQPELLTPSRELRALPVVPLKDLVVFPTMVMPLFVMRSKSICAIEDAMLHEQKLVLVAQKDPQVEDYTPDDVYSIGTLAQSLQVLKLPDGSLRVVVEGQKRVRLTGVVHTEPYFKALVEEVEETVEHSPEMEALVRTVLSDFQRAAELSRTIPPEAVTTAQSIDDPGRLADLVASNLSQRLEQKQQILETANVRERLEKLSAQLTQEIEILELERKIHSRVRDEIQAGQREMYLREQLKVIREELRETVAEGGEIEEYERKIEAAQMPEAAAEHARKELARLERMPAMSPEGSVIRTYLDWLTSLPWQARTEDNLDIEAAERVLEEDHYGLQRVKERVLEFLAAKKLAGPEMHSPILCFVGPPGVGKTSIGKSIARALGRKFIRLSLGGVRDEAEIRGHRRTYIGAMPGRIMQTIRQAGSRNPVFMMDEIDKLGMDFRGDPSAALLEVLDPEQNHSFSDHYLEVPFDLSEVMFITTANILDPVPPALRDRMEVIEFPGYTEEEKLVIAQRFLVPKQLKANGLKPGQVKFSKTALRDIVRYYTRESGVRNLEREIARICRKVARKVAAEDNRDLSLRVTAKALSDYLGPRKFIFGTAEARDEVGVATGLAITSAGGQVLTVEVSIVPGKGRLKLTGSLGEVMKESAEAALSYARSCARRLGVDDELFATSDIHIHLPEGAVPKDGPSAGITLALALCSAISKRPVSRHVATTGEVTLRGRVLPVGGIKEKVLAAHRAGIKTVVLPADNKKDLHDVPEQAMNELTLVFVRNMDQVLRHGLLNSKQPAPRKRVST